jgi:hypothetical protein
MNAKSGDESKAIVVNEERLFDYAPDYYRKLVPSEIGNIISEYSCPSHDFEKWLERVEPVFKVMYGLKERLAVNVERNAMTGFSISFKDEGGDEIWGRISRSLYYPPPWGQIRIASGLNISQYVEEMKVGLGYIYNCADSEIEYNIEVHLYFQKPYVHLEDLDAISNSTSVTWKHLRGRFGPDCSIHENNELELTILCTFCR